MTQTTTGVHLEAFEFAGGGWLGSTEDWRRNIWFVKEIAPHLEEEDFKLD